MCCRNILQEQEEEREEEQQAAEQQAGPFRRRVARQQRQPREPLLRDAQPGEQGGGVQVRPQALALLFSGRRLHPPCSSVAPV